MTKVRLLLRNIVLDILSGIFFKVNPGVYILNGHYISPKNGKSNGQFKELLYKLSLKFTLINIEKAIELINSDSIEFDKSYMAFTFDDGFEECYTEIAPALEEFGINCAFFVVPNFVDGDSHYIKNINYNYLNSTEIKKSMNWIQIRDLIDRDFIIGSHTMNHKRLTSLDENELIFEITNSKKIIQEKTNSKCDYFAYPYGKLRDISPLAVEIASNTYKYCFTQDDFSNYFSFNGRFINRRHFEPFWKFKHVQFFSRNRQL